MFEHSSHDHHSNYNLQMVMTLMQTREMTGSWDACLSLHIMCCFILLPTCGFQLDFVEEGSIGSLDIYMLALAFNLDSNNKEELQPTGSDLSGLTGSEQTVMLSSGFGQRQ